MERPAAVRRLAYGLTGIAVVAAGLVAVTPLAAAEPATTVRHYASGSATRFTGLAFDACTAPSLRAMSAWTASPYDGVGVYVGGRNRACRQPNLTAPWVRSVTAQGWRLIPIYVGHQAPCTSRSKGLRFSTSTATSIGKNGATDAVRRARSLGMLPGSAIYADLEHYNASSESCATAVRRYVSAWTKELHRLGYLSGVYVHISSGAPQLTRTYESTSYARPDAVWIARWDRNSSLTGWSGISDARWANGQRGKQYRGDHDERHGGVRINIDSDRFDAPVATVARSYRVTSKGSLSGRSAPSTKAGVVSTFAGGSTVSVVCQAAGTKVGATAVWDKLSDGSYVSDAYVSTSSSTTFSRSLPRCSYPAQVTTSVLNRRSGPTATSSIVGTSSSGSLAWITCQRSGSQVVTTKVWDRLVDGSYVSDYYVATRSSSTYSSPMPRCS